MILVHRDVVRLISVVYFLQGATGIAAVALPLYLRGSGMSIKEIAYYNSVVAIPWFFKIIYGVVSDAFPIGGFRRKPYIMICAALASLGWFLMAVFPFRREKKSKRSIPNLTPQKIKSSLKLFHICVLVIE